MDEPANKKVVDYVAQQRNWEQRVLSEHESPHKWRETWGTLFENEVPFDYEKRIEFLQAKLKKLPTSSINPPPKYGGQPLKEVAPRDFRRRKMFTDEEDEREN